MTSATGVQGQPAGTVVSFMNGVLTIMANDGNTASGRVTNATELKCEAVEPAEFEHHDRGRGDDRGGDNDRGDRGDDNGDDDNDEAQRDVHDRRPGTGRRRAEGRARDLWCRSYLGRGRTNGTVIRVVRLVDAVVPKDPRRIGGIAPPPFRQCSRNRTSGGLQGRRWCLE